MTFRPRQLGSLGAATMSLLVSGLGLSATLDVPLLITQVPSSDQIEARVSEPRGLLATAPFERARIIRLSPQGQVQVITEGFASACDPDVSFDGRSVLFAGKRVDEGRWRVWEMNLEGGGIPRALTPDHLEARLPIHVSTLFTLDSPEPWFTFVFTGWESGLNEAGGATIASLFNLKLDGTELRRLTYAPAHSADPFQMWDGRVLYAAESHPQEPRPEPSRVGIHAIHVEGADIERYVGPDGRRIQRMPCVSDGGLVIFVEQDEPSGGGGSLGCVSSRRPFVSYRPLTPPSAGEFLHPTPLAGNTVLAARRAAGAGNTFGIVSFDADTGRCETLFDTPEYHEVQAKPVRPRARPDGHSTVVNPKATTGVLYGMNAFTADPVREAHLRPGDIKRVRLIEGVTTAPAPDKEAAARWPVVPRRLIGEAPVEADGSFNVEVPADIPLLLQTLDARGLALGNCGWIWVKPKETRGCIGCHEDPERIPENEYVLALRRPSNRLVLPPAQRRELSFRQDVAPLLRKHCAAAECHGGRDTSLHLPLNANPPTEGDLRAAYAALMRPQNLMSSKGPPLPGRYVDQGRARSSWLIWQLTGVNTSRPWDPQEQSGDAPRAVQLMPPPGKGDPLREEDLRTVIQWIDLGGQFEPAELPKAAATKLVEAR